MGNRGSNTGEISNNRVDPSGAEVGAKRYLVPELWIRSCPSETVKVLPDPESKQRLRQTNNGEILYSGGTLSGRYQTRVRNAQSSSYASKQRYSFYKTGLDSTLCQNRQNVSSQKSLEHQLKLYKSEPDLRLSSAVGREMQEKKIKKKYKAPQPPSSTLVQEKHSWNDESPSRRTRLFKTRFETKKEFCQANVFEQSTDNSSDIVEKQIRVRENINSLRPKTHLEFNLNDSHEFNMKLRKATDHRKATNIAAVTSERLVESTISNIHSEMMANNDPVIERRGIRGEPSGKESSTPEASPILGATDIQKRRVFYFGMDREDSDASSSYPVEDDEDRSTIALRLRPVLPRKPTQIPRFSPAAAWKLLDARSQDSGISGDARSPLSFSWTPQQDLGDDSSIDDVIRDEPRAVTRKRPHVFSLSLPRDHQPAAFLAMTSNKSGVSSLGRLKRSVSGILNTLSIRREQERRTSSREDDSNWFFTRSAPNSLNENSLEIPEACFPYTSSTARLIYLPETTNRMSPVEDKYSLSILSKSCEEHCVTEPVCDVKAVLDIQKKTKAKKFTFQSTLRQIERKKMADKLSKEAEKKEKQRLGELEAMRRVEEEFQKKRAKEKANICQQLSLYAMNDKQWTSLPFDINSKSEERQEPEGALSSSNSSLSPSKSYEEFKENKNLEFSITTPVTKELSEYRQTQRNYKEYRGSTKYVSEKKHLGTTTVHPEISFNMPNAKGLNLENGNYRKYFVYGMKSTKSNSSHQSDDYHHLYSPTNKYSPITRF